jgi:GNAT superfamily N-acetyltransferase
MAARDERFWAGFFGLDPAVWNEPGASLVAHAGLGPYEGIWSFRHAERSVVSAPPAWLERLRPHIAEALLAELADVAWWRARLGSDVARVIGPAYQGCLSPSELCPVGDDRVALLTDGIAEAVEGFRAGIAEGDWNDGGLDGVGPPLALLRESGRIVAMSGYRAWNETTGDACVLVAPEFRGRGLGAAVTSAVVQAALGQGRLVLYQTLESNQGALAIARRLGFRRFATYLAIRLHADGA